MMDNASTDEELMVALTLLPRLLNPENKQEMELSFSHIPWSFVSRLLKATEKQLNCIGISIWCGFCEAPFYKHKKYMKRLLPVTALLSRTDRQLQENILRCISTLVKGGIPLEMDVWENIVSIEDHELFLEFLLILFSCNSEIDGEVAEILLKRCADIARIESKTKQRSLEASVILLSNYKVSSFFKLEYEYQ